MLLLLRFDLTNRRWAAAAMWWRLVRPSSNAGKLVACRLQMLQAVLIGGIIDHRFFHKIEGRVEFALGGVVAQPSSTISLLIQRSAR